MPSVLICDPNYSTTLTLSGALEFESFDILVARDSDDARFKIIMESPDFVLIDWLEFNIVHMNIKSFISQLKHLRPNTMFIFISHKGIQANISTFESLVQNHGADSYIIKPFNPTHVVEQLKNWSVKMTR